MTTPTRGVKSPKSLNKAPQDAPYKRADPSSPSRQLLWELSRLQLQEHREFQARLDEQSERRAALHKAALAASVAEHDRIREVAESIRQQEELKLEARRQDELAQERRRVAELRRRREQQDREAEEEVERQKQAEDRARREAEERKEQAAAEARRRELEDLKRKEEAATAARHEENERVAQLQRQRDIEQRARERTAALKVNGAFQPLQQPGQPPATSGAPVPPASHMTTNGASLAATQSTSPEAAYLPEPGHPLEVTHQRYLQIHQNLKIFRQWMKKISQTDESFKNFLGDTRRTIRKRIGQLQLQAGDNRERIREVRELLRQALSRPCHKVDVTLFLIDGPEPSADTQVPATLIFFLNWFTKALLQQARQEGTARPEMINAFGVFAVSILGTPIACWNRRPLTDILIAKLHRDCPPLFGIYGPENTDQGKARIGWKREKDFDGKLLGWTSKREHEAVMQGTAAIFASLTLRNYVKSPNLINPYPSWNFWNSMALITNLPPEEVQDSHAICVRAMIDMNVERIMDFFGEPAKLLLRHALIDFPHKFDREDGPHSPAVRQLEVLKAKLAKDLMLHLE